MEFWNSTEIKAAVLVLSVLFLAGCKDREEEDQVARDNRELEELKEETARLRGESKQHYDEMNDVLTKTRRIDRVERELYNAEQKLEPLEKYNQIIEEGIGHYRAEVERWRVAHRKSLVGLRTSSMPKTDGSALENVVIREVRDDEVVLTTNGIEMTLPMTAFDDSVVDVLVHEAKIEAAIRN